MKRFRLGVIGIFAAIGLLAMPAMATAISFNLNTEFSGGTPPAGTAPWVTATFADIANGAQLTITAANLTGSEFIGSFYFNFNPNLNSALYLGTVPGTGTQTVWDSKGAGNDAWKADGDGFFDFYVAFPTAANQDRFTNGETFVWEWLNLGLTAADFNYISVNGPVGKTGFHAAAHVQGIGPNSDSGWIGDKGTGTPPPVPEASSLLLLCCGIGIVALARRKSIADFFKK